MVGRGDIRGMWLKTLKGRLLLNNFLKTVLHSKYSGMYPATLLAQRKLIYKEELGRPCLYQVPMTGSGQALRLYDITTWNSR